MLLLRQLRRHPLRALCAPGQRGSSSKSSSSLPVIVGAAVGGVVLVAIVAVIVVRRRARNKVAAPTSSRSESSAFLNPIFAKGAGADGAYLAPVPEGSSSNNYYTEMGPKPLNAEYEELRAGGSAYDNVDQHSEGRYLEARPHVPLPHYEHAGTGGDQGHYTLASPAPHHAHYELAGGDGKRSEGHYAYASISTNARHGQGDAAEPYYARASEAASKGVVYDIATPQQHQQPPHRGETHYDFASPAAALYDNTFGEPHYALASPAPERDPVYDNFGFEHPGQSARPSASGYLLIEGSES